MNKQQLKSIIEERLEHLDSGVILITPHPKGFFIKLYNHTLFISTIKALEELNIKLLCVFAESMAYEVTALFEYNESYKEIHNEVI